MPFKRGFGRKIMIVERIFTIEKVWLGQWKNAFFFKQNKNRSVDRCVYQSRRTLTEVQLYCVWQHRTQLDNHGYFSSMVTAESLIYEIPY